MVLASLLLFLTAPLFAQNQNPCNGPKPDHPEIDWVDAGCCAVEISGHCTVTVCVCTRVVDGVTQYYVRSIDYDPVTSPCDDIQSWQEMITKATYEGVRCAGGVPFPCSTQFTIPAITLVTAQCWFQQSYTDANGTQWLRVGPCPTSAFCKKSVRLCWDDLDHHVVVHEVVSTELIPGDNCQPEPPGGVHQNNVCYSIDPCATE